MSNNYLSSKKGLSKKSLKELIKLCKRNNIPPNGTKKELIEKLALKSSNNSSSKHKGKHKRKSSKQSSQIKFFTKTNHQQLLLYGYIRRIEQNTFNASIIIPNEIYDLFMMFHVQNSFLLILFNTKTMKNIHATDIDLKMNRKYTMNPNTRPLTSPWLKNDISSFCYHRNVSLPSQITQQFTRKSLTRNVIFQCCTHSQSKSQQSMVYIMDNNNNTVSDYKLPIIPRKICKSSLIFNETHGLLSFGGKDANKKPLNWVWRLKWKSIDNEEEWKWEKLTNLNQHRVQSTCIYIPNENKVMIIGGYLKKSSNAQFQTRAELYDMNNIKMKSKLLPGHNASNRDQCGGFYDDLTRRVYVGGGYGIKSDYGYNVSFYECNKNTWCDKFAPNTSLDYGSLPILWMDNYDRQLLYIAGNVGMESFDLRTNGRKWNIVYQQSDLKNVFGIEESIHDKFTPVFLH